MSRRSSPNFASATANRSRALGNALVHTAAPVLRGVARRVRRTAQRVVASAGVGADRQQHPTHVGEQQRPRAEVRLPLHLHGVGDVEALDRARRAVREQVGAGVAAQVGEADPGAAVEDRAAAAARTDGLVPDHGGRIDALRQVDGVGGGDRRLVPVCPRWPPGHRACARAVFGRGRLAHRSRGAPGRRPPFDGLSKVVPRLKRGAGKSRRGRLCSHACHEAHRARPSMFAAVATRSDVEPPRRTGRPRRSTREIVEDDPRSGILAAAGRLFAERGVSGTTMVEIARASGLRQSSLYYYFHNKEHVLEAIVVEANRVPLALVEQVRARGRSGRGPALPDHPRRRGRLVRIALRPERDPSTRRPRPRDLPPLLGASGRC